MKKRILLIALIAVIVLVGVFIVRWLLSPAGQVWGRAWIGRPDGLTATFTVFAGVGTVGAVIVALFGIRYERRRAQEDRVEAQRRFEDEQAHARDELRDERERFEKAQEESRRQFLESQKQTQDALEEGRRQFLEAQYSANRPILIPLLPPANFNPPMNIDWNGLHWAIPVINVGNGVATNVWCVLLPPEPMLTSSHQFSLQVGSPIRINVERPLFLRQGGTVFGCEDKIGEYSLCVPIEYAPEVNYNPASRKDRCIARLTFTYHDIFGNKHASISDLTQMGVWVNRALIPYIQHDLGEMDEAKGEMFKPGSNPIPSIKLDRRNQGAR